jgi:hypothetical protein
MPISFDDIPIVNPPSKKKTLSFDDIPRTPSIAPEAADHGLSERQKLSPLEKAISPITSYPATYDRMNREAQDEFSQGVDQVLNATGAGDVAKGVGKAALGGVGYLTSPINAAYRSIAGQPIEDVTGIPREQTEFALQLATPGIGLTGGKPPAPRIAPPVAPAANALTPGQEVVEAANRLSQTGAPVEVSRAVASDSVPVQQAGKVVANIPYAGAPLVNAVERNIGQLGSKADEVAAGFGGASTPAESGNVASTSLENWITGKSKAVADRLYNRVDQHIDPDLAAPLDHTLDAVSQIIAKRTGAGLGSTKAIDTVLPALQKAAGLTYQDVKTLRTEIRDMLDASVLPGGPKDAAAEGIYGALTKDLGNIVSQSGPQAQAAFDRANSVYQSISQRRSDLAKIIGTDAGAPAERVFDRLSAMAGSSSRADIVKLAQARKAMGADDWGEVASTVVSNLGRDAEGNFSPDRFVTGWNKMSDAGRNVMFRSTGNEQLASHLDDIATISSRYRDLQRFGNPSGTARGVAGSALFFEPLTTLKAMVGGNIVARALAVPAKAASIAKYSQAQLGLAASPSPATAARFGIASRNLIATLGATHVKPSDLYQAATQPQQGQ